MTDVAGATIREATLDDLPALLGLWRLLEEAQGAYRPLPLPADADARMAASLRHAIEAPDGCVLLADVDGLPVGMAVLHVDRPSRMSDERAVEVGRVVVDPAHRKRGIAQEFVARAEAFARERGISWLGARIFSANTDALRFWERAGFFAVYEQRLRRLD